MHDLGRCHTAVPMASRAWGCFLLLVSDQRADFRPSQHGVITIGGVCARIFCSCLHKRRSALLRTNSADAARGRFCFCHDRVFFAFATGNTVTVRKDSCPFRHRKEQVSVGVAGSQI
ncbi:hypothetical protein M431DRAFT_388697 [Trichoderma harzianum CBS 226.95]|uniref:Uncharacterized protein n=1 Tax=Trichoderma harzianum CBS 226.95 TaxID=983964 RepID=A0A2T4AIK2_TRIHA|nr:hypothetical protein M431DRAFT_388697 [Trichoderma harzianum CBS 226.95]PTB56893.1 hypothetical protein M431DRAFT_388697 [Trichoderma harzianum CBS 226.95]